MSMFLYMSPTAYNEDMPIWKEASEKTGIRIKSTVPSTATDEETAYATMLAGDKLPDMIKTNADKLKTLGDDGALIPLDDLIEEHAPNIKAFFEQCPEAKQSATGNDGKIYFIPGSLSGLDNAAAPAEGFFIRTDWLEKLNLKVPTTIDELHDVLYAFKTQDPNGNGIQDEIPFFDRKQWADRMFQLFCASDKWMIDEKTGKMVHGAIQENYKNAMKTMAQWFKEGLIDNEIYTRSSAREQLLGQNLGGCTYDWFSSTSKFNETYAKEIEGFKFEAMLPPKDVEGKVKNVWTRSTLHGRGWGITIDCPEEDVVNAIKYFDFWMSEEGQQLMAFGVEGVSYTLDESGNVVWSEEALSYSSGVPEYMRSIGNAEIGTIGNLESEKSSMNEIGRAGFEMYEDIGVSPIPSLNLTEEEKKVSSKYTNNITTCIQEQQQKWIFGTEDVDATWDKYVETLKGMGIEELTEVQNAAYQRYLKGLN